MKVELFCYKCKEPLEIRDEEIGFLDNLKLFVEPCHNKDCYVCGNCEEVETREKTEEELRNALDKLENIQKEIRR